MFISDYDNSLVCGTVSFFGNGEAEESDVFAVGRCANHGWGQ
jgi:hypothetical protein